MSYGNLTTPIPGTIIFDGREAMKGYAAQQDVLLLQQRR